MNFVENSPDPFLDGHIMLPEAHDPLATVDGRHPTYPSPSVDPGKPSSDSLDDDDSSFTEHLRDAKSLYADMTAFLQGAKTPISGSPKNGNNDSPNVVVVESSSSWRDGNNNSFEEMEDKDLISLAKEEAILQLYRERQYRGVNVEMNDVVNNKTSFNSKGTRSTTDLESDDDDESVFAEEEEDTSSLKITIAVGNEAAETAYLKATTTNTKDPAKDTSSVGAAASSSLKATKDSVHRAAEDASVRLAAARNRAAETASSSIKATKDSVHRVAEDASVKLSAVGDMFSEVLQPAQEEAALIRDEASVIFGGGSSKKSSSHKSRGSSSTIFKAADDSSTIATTEEEEEEEEEAPTTTEEEAPSSTTTTTTSTFQSLANGFSSKLKATGVALQDSMRPAAEQVTNFFSGLEHTTLTDVFDPAKQEAILLCGEMNQSCTRSKQMVGEVIDPAKEELIMTYRETSRSFVAKYSFKKERSSPLLDLEEAGPAEF